MEAGRDYWYHDLMALPIARMSGGGNRCDTEVMDAEDPLFMLYTSGTTGKPKAILHTHGGYMVGVGTSLKWVFDLKEEDRCGAPPTPAGSRGIHISSTDLCCWAPPVSSTKALRRTIPQPLVEHGREVRDQCALHRPRRPFAV